MDLGGDKNLEQIFASERSGAVRVGSGAVRVDFDCTLILLVEAIKQKAGVVSFTINFVTSSNSDCGEVSYLMMKTQEKRGI